MKTDGNSIAVDYLATDVMVDFETLGTDTNTCLPVSIAALAFNRKNFLPGQYYNPGVDKKCVTLVANSPVLFYTPISMMDGLGLGRTIDPGTANFYKTIDRSELVYSITSDVTVHEAISQLAAFLRCFPNAYKWARGPRFDFNILASLCEQLNIENPVDFRKECCHRTILLGHEELEPAALKDVIEVTFEHNFLPKHNPIYDCVLQAYGVYKVYGMKHEH